MNVTEFKKLAIISEKEVEYQGIKFKVKQSLNYQEKMSFLNYLTLLCFDEITGVDHLKKDMGYTHLILKNFTDIKLPQYKDEDSEIKYDDGLVIYDIAKNSGLFDFVIENIPIEVLEDLDDLIENTLSEKYYQVKLKNNIGATISKVLSKIADLDIIGIMEQMKDPAFKDNFSMIKDVMNFNNGDVDEIKLNREQKRKLEKIVKSEIKQ